MQRSSRCDPIQASQWKRQLLDRASVLFTSGKQTKYKAEGQAFDARELCKLADHDHPGLNVLQQHALLGLVARTTFSTSPHRHVHHAADHGQDRCSLS
jgi:hypothetical protein